MERNDLSPMFSFVSRRNGMARAGSSTGQSLSERTPDRRPGVFNAKLGECTMSVPLTYSLMRYLAAKKSVDDRALNWQVWQCLVAALPRATTEQPLRILEVGAGIGSMVERLVGGDVLTHATYTAIDQAPTLLAEACRRLRQWTRERGFQVDEPPGTAAFSAGRAAHH